LQFSNSLTVGGKKQEEHCLPLLPAHRRCNSTLWLELSKEWQLHLQSPEIFTSDIHMYETLLLQDSQC